jgi:hypothetical protein
MFKAMSSRNKANRCGERRIGVELEFGGVSPEMTASIIETEWGGCVTPDGPNRFRVDDTALGRIVVELDAQLVLNPWIDQKEARRVVPEKVLEQSVKAEETAREFIGAVGELVVPTEIVFPPIARRRLREIDDFIPKLREAGAFGSRSGVLYGFGLQLNPEVLSTDVSHLVAVLRAYVMASPWLREQVSPDLTRRILPFTRPFPEDYVRLLVSAEYDPDLGRFIDDYLEYNPTRNRELDLLPLLAHLEEARVRAALPDAKINSRPTWHYRLPESDLETPGWSVENEWLRFRRIEKLALDAGRLSRALEAYRRHIRATAPQDVVWVAEFERLLG